MHLALIKYTVLRLALFVVALIVLYAVHVRASIVLYAAAALISLLLSYLLLGKPREELATAIAERVGNRVQRRHAAMMGDDDVVAEDLAAEEMSAHPQPAIPAHPEPTISAGAEPTQGFPAET